MPSEIQIQLDQNESVSGLVYAATGSRLDVTVLLGHGAGASQKSAFMVVFAEGLALRGIDSATFNFLYAEQGRRTPDRTDKLEACYLAAIEAVRSHNGLSKNRLVIGGKSLGGRIASRVAAAGLGNLAGLVFLGYPLHPPGKPDQLRTDHLPRITAPMLFVQGSRDPFGTPEELKPIIKKLKLPATLYTVENGDHSLAAPKGSGRSKEQIHSDVMDEIVRWLALNNRLSA